MWKLSRCSNGVRDFPRRGTLCVFAAIYRATFVFTSRRRRHRGLSSACAWCPHFHAISGHLVSLTGRSWSKSISPITCKTFSKRQKMTKKTKNADRNRPETTTPSCFAPDVLKLPDRSRAPARPRALNSAQNSPETPTKRPTEPARGPPSHTFWTRGRSDFFTVGQTLNVYRYALLLTPDSYVFWIAKFRKKLS